ncbi:hypothetical protein BGX31_001150, partial [Mortierella sp. GBA43]
MPPCFPVAVFLSNFVEELNLPPQSFPAPVIPDDFVDEWDFDDFVDELDLDDLSTGTNSQQYHKMALWIVTLILKRN